jgi:hypothetical protein
MRCVPRRNARPVRVIKIAVVLHNRRRMLGADLVAAIIQRLLKNPRVDSYVTPGAGLHRRPSGNEAITISSFGCD